MNRIKLTQEIKRGETGYQTETLCFNLPCKRGIGPNSAYKDMPTSNSLKPIAYLACPANSI
jgi:hypothetical protein